MKGITAWVLGGCLLSCIKGSDAQLCQRLANRDVAWPAKFDRKRGARIGSSCVGVQPHKSGLVTSDQCKECSFPGLRHAVVGQVGLERVGDVILGQRFNEEHGSGDRRTSIGMPDVPREEGWHIFQHDDTGPKRLCYFCNHYDQEIAFVSASSIGVPLETTFATSRTHTLAWWAGSEKRRPIIPSFLPVCRHHPLPRLDQVARNPRRLGVVKKGNLKPARIKFRHNVETEAGLPEAQVACAAVREEANGTEVRPRPSHDACRFG
jgi:hypothetical protein